MLKTAAAGMVLLCAANATMGAVKLPSIISDNMVLQRSAQTPLWGNADPGEKVTAKFGDASGEAVADAGGKWRLELNLQDAGESAGELVIAGSNTITIKNAIVGEVWVCSGQSNMSWNVGETLNVAQEAKDFPGIREFRVSQVIAYQPQSDIDQGRWVVATNDTTPAFTAVGFYFGRELHLKTGQPVGLINSSWGGTDCESWTSRSQLEKDGELKAIVAAHDVAMKADPKPPTVAPDNPNQPAVLYNSMIAPLTPYRIKGAIWYQGESNTGRWKSYEELLTLMIEGWRSDWGIGDFPFYIVQLANYQARDTEPSTDAAWAQVRDAQYNVSKNVPNSGLATAIDIGEAEDIHPRNKQDVGKRLALIALAKDYGVDVECSGPQFKSLKIEGHQAIVTFDHAKGLNARDGEPRRFAIAGADGKFVWANARIDGDRIIVWSDEVPSPKEVRYGRGQNPEVNVYNAAGLPLLPFVAVAE